MITFLLVAASMLALGGLAAWVIAGVDRYTFDPPTCEHCRDSGILNVEQHDDVTGEWHPAASFCHACKRGDEWREMGLD